jgi:uncharacterized membrane protein YheB (UPF0754 family)
MLYTFPFISAAIGWLTNFVAIKMLFYPREPLNLVFFTLQGIFPKRKAALAQRMARLVSEELLSTESLRQEIDHQATHGDIKQAIEDEVENYLREKVSSLNPLISSLINEQRIMQLKTGICRELEAFIPKITRQFFDKLDTVNIERMVYEKIASFSSDKLESMMMAVLQKELKFIELAGAILGFLIGWIQVLMLILWGDYPT